MREVYLELEGLKKRQRNLQTSRDLQSFAGTNNTGNTIQEEIAEQSIHFSLEIESISV